MMGQLPAGAMGLLGGMPPTIHNPSATPGINPNAQPPPGGPLAGLRGRIGQGFQNIMQPAEGGGMKPGMMAALYGLNLLSQPNNGRAFGNALQGTMGMVGQMQTARQRKDLLDMRKVEFEQTQGTRKQQRDAIQKLIKNERDRAMANDNVIDANEQRKIDMLEMAMVSPDPSKVLSGIPGFGGNRIGPVQPGDVTFDSLSEYDRTGNFDALQRYEPGRTVKHGGTTYGFDPATKAFYPLQAPEDAGADEGAAAVAKDDVTAAGDVARTLSGKQSDIMDTLVKTNELLANKEGIAGSTGVRGIIPPFRGTPEALFESQVGQLAGRATLENVDKLTGVLSESDMAILRSSSSRLADTKVGTPQYVRAVEDFQRSLIRGLNNAREKAGLEPMSMDQIKRRVARLQGESGGGEGTLTSPGGVQYRVVPQQ